jgi:hypothetical protein
MLAPLITLTLVTRANLVTLLTGNMVILVFCNIGYVGKVGRIATLVTKVTTKKILMLVINMTTNIKGLLILFLY